jgi:hypothetical protein
MIISPLDFTFVIYRVFGPLELPGFLLLEGELECGVVFLVLGGGGVSGRGGAATAATSHHASHEGLLYLSVLT